MEETDAIAEAERWQAYQRTAPELSSRFGIVE
jgi:hypothetical protein